MVWSFAYFPSICLVSWSSLHSKSKKAVKIKQIRILYCICRISFVLAYLKHLFQNNGIISRPGRSQGLLYKHLRHWLTELSFVIISSRRRHTLKVEDGAFSHKIDYFIIFPNIDGHCWLNSYGNFHEWVDFAYWRSFSGGGSVINGATLSSLSTNQLC